MDQYIIKISVGYINTDTIHNNSMCFSLETCQSCWWCGTVGEKNHNRKPLLKVCMVVEHNSFL